jgi:hypothetical protein
LLIAKKSAASDALKDHNVEPPGIFREGDQQEVKSDILKLRCEFGEHTHKVATRIVAPWKELD